MVGEEEEGGLHRKGMRFKRHLSSPTAEVAA